MHNICDWSGFYELFPPSQLCSMIINQWEIIKYTCKSENLYRNATLDSCVLFCFVLISLSAQRFVG